MTTKRTPGEWKVEDGNFIVAIPQSGNMKMLITETYDTSNYLPRTGTFIPDEPEGAANAEHICLCVNNHDKLVGALKEAYEIMGRIKIFQAFQNNVEVLDSEILSDGDESKLLEVREKCKSLLASLKEETTANQKINT